MFVLCELMFLCAYQHIIYPPPIFITNERSSELHILHAKEIMRLKLHIVKVSVMISSDSTILFNLEVIKES